MGEGDNLRPFLCAWERLPSTFASQLLDREPRPFIFRTYRPGPLSVTHICQRFYPDSSTENIFAYTSRPLGIGRLERLEGLEMAAQASPAETLGSGKSRSESLLRRTSRGHSCRHQARPWHHSLLLQPDRPGKS